MHVVALDTLDASQLSRTAGWNGDSCVFEYLLVHVVVWAALPQARETAGACTVGWNGRLVRVWISQLLESLRTHVVVVGGLHWRGRRQGLQTGWKAGVCGSLRCVNHSGV